MSYYDKLFLMIQLLLSAYMTGIVLFVQFSQYPLFRLIKTEMFEDYHKNYIKRSTIPIAAPMILEMLLAVSWALSKIHSSVVYFILVLCIWFITLGMLVPAHNKLQSGFSEQVLKKLLRANALRGLFWALKTLILVAYILNS